ncbi:MAG: OmpA family protein [Bacteroidetes bacterium]|nr:OmpA family protein [Bacteroidota bacterium]
MKQRVFGPLGALALFMVLLGLSLAAQAQPAVAEENPILVYRADAPKKASQAWENALASFQQKDLEKALTAVREAIRLEPGFVDAHLLAGDIYATAQRDSQAIAAFERGLALDPDYQNGAWLRLATLQTRVGGFDEAAQSLDAYADRNSGERADVSRSEAARLRRLAAAVRNPVPFAPLNLGDSVNSEHAEYLPSLSLDDSVMVFTRRLDGRNEDFYLSRRGPDGSWSSAVNLGPPVNTPLNEGAQNLSADGTLLLFTKCNEPDGIGSCDLYESQYIQGKGWSAARNLGPVVNSPQWDSQPCLSADGQTLYFSSTRPGGQGERDLWMSRRGGTAVADGGAAASSGGALRPGEWTAPVNLGPVVNSPEMDQAPFLHPDGATLYFTSEGHGTLGGSDLFLCRLGLDGAWQAPENLGFPINTSDNEGSLIVSADGRTAYYASDRADSRGQLDIYSFELPEHLRARPVTYVRARVRDALTGKPLAAAVELTDVASGEMLTRSSATPGTGEFLVVLPSDRDYALNVMRKDYLFASANFSLPEGSALEPFVIDIALVPLQPGGELVLRNVFFASGSALLDDRSRHELQRLFDLLQNQPTLRIRIGGHTDDVGAEADNQRLSEARALAVRDYLVAAGVAPERLEYRGYGESRPVEAGVSEAARALNRRTTVEVL